MKQFTFCRHLTSFKIIFICGEIVHCNFKSERMTYAENGNVSYKMLS